MNIDEMLPPNKNTIRLDDEKIFKDFKAMQSEYRELYSSYFSKYNMHNEVSEKNICKSSVYMIDMVLQCCLVFKRYSSSHSMILKRAKAFLITYTNDLRKLFEQAEYVSPDSQNKRPDIIDLDDYLVEGYDQNTISIDSPPKIVCSRSIIDADDQSIAEEKPSSIDIEDQSIRDGSRNTISTNQLPMEENLGISNTNDQPINGNSQNSTMYDDNRNKMNNNIVYSDKRLEMENIFIKFSKTNQSNHVDNESTASASKNAQQMQNISSMNKYDGDNTKNMNADIQPPDIHNNTNAIIPSHVGGPDTFNSEDINSFASLVSDKSTDVININDDLFKSLGLSIDLSATESINENRPQMNKNMRNKKRYRFNTNTNVNKKKRIDNTQNNNRQVSRTQHRSLSKNFFANIRRDKSTENPLPSFMAQDVNNTKSYPQKTSYTSQISNLCIRRNISHPEYVLEHTNDMFICTAEFFKHKFTSRYFKTREEAKEDVCRLICAFLEPMKNNIDNYYK